MSFALRRHLYVLLAYTLAALALTWPLARHFITHMPGNGIDDPALGWNLWWLKTRLVDQLNLDIFHVGWMFHPIAINLAFYTLTPLNGLLSIPLQTVFGLIVANNLILLSSFILAGYGTFLLVRNEVLGIGRPAILKPIPNTQYPISIASFAPFFAGFVYAFASSKLFYAALGQFNIASSHWIPFCVLYVLRIGRSTSLHQALRNSALAGLFLVFQAWAELTYASFLLIFIATYFLWLLVSQFRSLSRITHYALRITPPFVLMAAIFIVGLSPFLWAMLPDLRTEGDFFTSGGGFSDTFSADLAGYLVPTRLHPLLGDWVAGLPFSNNVGQQIFLGYSVLGIGVFGAIVLICNPQSVIRNRGGFWLFNTFFFWWMTLGPHVRWLGRDLPIPGPFSLISLLPVFNGNRYPSRYSVMLLLCVAVLVGYGISTLLNIIDRHTNRDREIERLRRSPNLSISQSLNLLVILLSIAIFTIEHLSIPLPLNDFRVPEVYNTLAAQPGDFAILELPTGWRNGARVLGKSDKLIMMQQWYQTVHGKRRLGGNTSRNPPYKFQYFTEAPLLGDLIALMNADQSHMRPVIDAEFATLVARNRPIAAQVLRDLDILYVTVHVDRASPALLRFVEEALPLALVEEWRGADWEGNPSTIRLYRVQQSIHPPEQTIDLAAEMGKLYLGPGWSALPMDRVRYATRTTTELQVPIPDQGDTLAFELLPPATAVYLWLNGVRLGNDYHLAVSQWVTVTIPAGVATAPVDQLTLQFTGLPTPIRSLRTPPDPGWPIGATGATLAAPLFVRSAGEEVGDFAQLWVNGVDVAINERGYNLGALDATGQVLATAVFDTLAGADQSAALGAWIDQWPAGTIIAGAVADEASYNLQQDAIDALRRVGVSGDLRSRFRWSHAFVGVVGATPGQALEQMSLIEPATVFVGVVVDGAAVSGGVGRIRFK